MDINILSLNHIVKKYNNHNKNKKEITNDVKESIAECIAECIVEYNYYFKNNIKNCEKIKNIANYKIFFITISDFKEINININSPQEELIPENKYIFVDYDINIKNSEIKSFNHFFRCLPNNKLFIYHIYNSYCHLLNSLNLLLENNIYPVDLNHTNIIFDTDTLLKPRLIHFDLCLNETSNNEDFIKIIDKCTNYSLKPIEMHLLFYLYKNNINYIDSSFILEIVENFVNNVSFFNLFSLNYKKQYKESLIQFLNNYINKPKEYIIDSLCVFKVTWANYSISVLYLHLIGNIIKTFGLKNTILNKILLILNKNINPSPLKRESVNNSIKYINKLAGEFLNWDFVNELDKNNKNIEK